MRLWLNTLLGIAMGTYFVLTSIYCLLAFLPYTYCAFIKAPPYPWMPWFVRHQALLYFAAVASAVISRGQKWATQEKNRAYLAGVGALAFIGIYLSFRPFLPTLQDNRAAYAWSLAALLLLSLLSLWRLSNVYAENGNEKNKSNQVDGKSPGYFAYSGGLLTAGAASVIYLAGTQMRIFGESHATALHASNFELWSWSLISHCALAIAILSALNLVLLLASKTHWPQTVSRSLTGAFIVFTIEIILARFLDTAMSFDGWAARIYAATLALTLTLWGFSLVLPILSAQNLRPGRDRNAKSSWRRTFAIWTMIAVLSTLALASHSLIGGEDWNGFVGDTWALVFWISLSLCVYALRPRRAHYSGTVVIGILLGSAFLYKGLQATEIFWSKPLGSTDDEISLNLEEYGSRDASFQLAHHALGNGRPQNCGDLCRILREYTNVRDTHITNGVRLVENLTPTSGERPNIFIFVVDSMRPDYLGAYNPKQVDYTPNLDALAKDSVVFHHAYTQYAGTSLSEPAIWTGSMLLHAHFPEPFAAVNSLRTLAHTDGYQTIVSYDSVLQQLFPPADDLTTLDTNKALWNQYEACSTVEQLESNLDARKENSPPIFFYAQPMNVHQFARNDVPSPSSQHWQGPAEMSGRISYEVHWVDSCLGGFFSYLKRHGMYDDSIIIVASDHGDATGEFGRMSHSTSIWPEIMRVPLMVHLPPKMRQRFIYDDNRISTLTDIAPSLYYLLGHGPVRKNALYGRPLFAATQQELDGYEKRDLLLASDVRAVYGILSANERYLYTTYDSPAQSYLFDLTHDANAQHNILTPALKQQYDEEIIEHLQAISTYYGSKHGVGSLMAASSQ